jgi:hypothetical protein
MARSNNNNKLKAFVRFDGSGRIIPSSLIVQAFKPKVGNYQEIDAKECCNYVPPTTTSTTTVAPTTTTSTTIAPTTTTTTTLEVFNFIGRGGDSSVNACNGSNETFYTTGPLNFIYPQNGNVVYFDQALTQLVTYAYIASPGVGQVFDCTNGVLSNQQNCV